jgi:hypothetical protein
MRTTLLILCGLSAGCSASFTGLAVEGANRTDATVTVTTDISGERISIVAAHEDLACLGLRCETTRVPGEAACNDTATNPFAGTAVAEFFACYGASGACASRSGFPEGLDFANGARLERDGSGSDNDVSLIGPGASEACIVGGEQFSVTSPLLFFQL